MIKEVLYILPVSALGAGLAMMIYFTAELVDVVAMIGG